MGQQIDTSDSLLFSRTRELHRPASNWLPSHAHMRDLPALRNAGTTQLAAMILTHVLNYKYNTPMRSTPACIARWVGTRHAKDF